MDNYKVCEKCGTREPILEFRKHDDFPKIIFSGLCIECYNKQKLEKGIKRDA